MRTHRTAVVGILLAATLALPSIALAQAMQPMQPMNGAPMMMNDANHVVGHVDSFDGHYRLRVAGKPVRLHQGTIIHPTGATITPGQRVIVRGHWNNGHFDADEVRIRR